MVRTSYGKRGKSGNRGRRGRYGKPAFVFVVLLVIGLLAALLFFLLQNKNAQAPVKAPGQASELPAQELSVWITDWQWEAGIEDWSALHKGTVDLQLFAAYFDERDELYFTETMSNALPRLHELTGVEADSDARIGLTLVNDIIHDDGSTVQKDPELLTRLTSTNESRARHMESITKIVERYGLDQIEIDYEQIKDQDWPNMIRFYEELALELDEMNVSLRIVLEPKAPIEELKLPEGPEYVMMAYNLYGGHSGPGPKADMVFIKELAARMSHLPGDPIMAFSAGGFDWSEGSSTVSLTEKAAADLLDRYEITPERDTKSGSLYFNYTDEDGAPHTVWYANHETLQGWMEEAGREGIHKYAIWRLGELGEDTRDLLREIE
ncbi:glycosyl hydrolase family 18 protein [Paenibacillus sp. FSL H7-0326]|uniref:glycosyl hydrolase family 18 protein n=1 Tax=Paenibacillus sp. FSL H7-0326 TaxID=1921144 RepID=UPI002115D250|nr:glycosyl hydrolase family 18 protein [Paenibacillus sp. FSL H7-0326]